MKPSGRLRQCVFVREIMPAFEAMTDQRDWSILSQQQKFNHFIMLKSFNNFKNIEIMKKFKKNESTPMLYKLGVKIGIIKNERFSRQVHKTNCQ